MSNQPTQEQKDRVKRRILFDEHDEESNGEARTIQISDTTCDAINTRSKDDENVTDHPTYLQNIIDLSNMTQAQKYAQMDKWNFDFENEVPLDGNWEWERVRPPIKVEHKEKVCALKKDEDNVDDRNV